jgi:hypothetical protein
VQYSQGSNATNKEARMEMPEMAMVEATLNVIVGAEALGDFELVTVIVTGSPIVFKEVETTMVGPGIIGTEEVGRTVGVGRAAKSSELG